MKCINRISKTSRTTRTSGHFLNAEAEAANLFVNLLKYDVNGDGVISYSDWLQSSPNAAALRLDQILQQKVVAEDSLVHRQTWIDFVNQRVGAISELDLDDDEKEDLRQTLFNVGEKRLFRF